MSECAGCRQPILDRYVCTVLDKSWHERCLRCSDCYRAMEGTCFSRDGLIYCKDDFARRYVQRCAGCDGILAKEDLVRRARDKVFHVHCFQCSVCQRLLDTGEQLYIVDGNRFVCQADFQASASTKSSTPSSTSNRPVSNGSECNSDADDENVETGEETVVDAEDGDKADDSAAAKRRGPRTTIKAKQLDTLRTAFASTPKPTRHIREQLAAETGLNMRVIQVWFQNRRSKERRMKQLRFGGYRPPRRSRGGRDDLCQEMFPGEAPFFPPPPPMGFFCADPYATDRPGGPFLAAPDGVHMLHDASLSNVVPGMADFEAETAAAAAAAAASAGYQPLPSMFSSELKSMAGW